MSERLQEAPKKKNPDGWIISTRGLSAGVVVAVVVEVEVVEVEEVECLSSLEAADDVRVSECGC